MLKAIISVHTATPYDTTYQHGNSNACRTIDSEVHEQTIFCSNSSNFRRSKLKCKSAPSNTETIAFRQALLRLDHFRVYWIISNLASPSWS